MDTTCVPRICYINKLVSLLSITIVLLSIFTLQASSTEVADTAMVVAKSNGPSNQKVTIPRIMHHIYWQWDKRKTVNKDRYEKWGVCRQTCIDKTPGYQYILWDDVMIEDLIMKHYHWIMPMYKSYDYEVQRSDVARYIILHHMGGLYLDMDDCCRVNMEPLVAEMEVRGHDALVPRVLPWGTGNDILVSTKGNDFMAYAIYHLLCTNKWYVIPYTTVLMSTGTLYLSARRKEYKAMYPQWKYKMLSVEDRAQKYIFRESGSTWHRIDGDIIFHVYSYYKTYTLLGILFAALLIVTCMKGRQRLLSKITGSRRTPSYKVSYA